jgi:hypothetical protein
MSWDAPPPQPPEPEQPQQGQPFAPQDGWITPAPQNSYEPAPPPYGQPGPYNQPGPYDQPGPQSQPGPYNQQPQPYGQTVPFGQYPTQPVAYDQYGQPLPPQPAAGQWGQYGAPAPFYGGPPPKRGRTGLFVGLGVGAAVIAAGVATALALGGATGTVNTASTGTTASPAASTSAGATDSPSTTPSAATQQTARTVSVPQSAGSLHLLTNSDTTSRITQLKTQLSGNAAYSNPQIGFYGIGSSTAYSVWMLAEDTTNIATFQDSVNALGVDAAAKEIATAASMKSMQTEPSGPLGGAMVCGTLSEQSVTVFACEWLDTTSFGWIYFMPSVTHTKALGYTLDLRAAAEK